MIKYLEEEIYWSLKMKILSDLGGIQEAYWDESEIQAALLDELVLHLEITFQNKQSINQSNKNADADWPWCRYI